MTRPMSEAIIGRIDDMGTRIDDLEKSIAELMQQAGVEEGDTAGALPVSATSAATGQVRK